MSRRLVLSFVLFTCLFIPARADQRWIVRSTKGMSAIQAICNLLSCSLIRGLGDPASQSFVIATPSSLNLNLPNVLTGLLHGPLLGNLGISDVEPDAVINLLGLQPSMAPLGGLPGQQPYGYLGSPAWNAYANQPAANIIRASEAQRTFNVVGTGVVAIIDTGIDSNHPALEGMVTPGYDFTTNQSATANEAAGLNQSTAAVVDGGPTTVAGSNTAALNQSTAAVVDGYGAFGHGTMVAGIVHLVAPRAYLMPLKAFRSDGQGYLSDVVRAVYWAVSNGARVLNMSFSTPGYSNAFQTALDYAASRNLVSVAAAGNNNSSAIVYPAGFRKDVMGVASTNLMDQKSSFSDYGPQDVWIAAPGENIVSTYPFDSYAQGSGTSFSAPFVTGTVALLLSQQWGANESGASNAIAHAKPLGPGLGNGRLDVYQALSPASSQMGGSDSDWPHDR